MKIVTRTGELLLQPEEYLEYTDGDEGAVYVESDIIIVNVQSEERVNEIKKTLISIYPFTTPTKHYVNVSSANDGTYEVRFILADFYPKIMP